MEWGVLYFIKKFGFERKEREEELQDNIVRTRDWEYLCSERKESEKKAGRTEEFENTGQRERQEVRQREGWRVREGGKEGERERGESQKEEREREEQ